MNIYNVHVWVEDGVLKSNHAHLPRQIQLTVIKKIKQYVNCAIDILDPNIIHYILKVGYKEKWTYYNGINIIHLHYMLEVFDINKMYYP